MSNVVILIVLTVLTFCWVSQLGKGFLCQMSLSWLSQRRKIWVNWWRDVFTIDNEFRGLCWCWCWCWCWCCCCFCCWHFDKIALTLNLRNGLADSVGGDPRFESPSSRQSRSSWDQRYQSSFLRANKLERFPLDSLFSLYTMKIIHRLSIYTSMKHSLLHLKTFYGRKLRLFVIS